MVDYFLRLGSSALLVNGSITFVLAIFSTGFGLGLLIRGGGLVGPVGEVGLELEGLVMIGGIEGFLSVFLLLKAALLFFEELPFSV